MESAKKMEAELENTVISDLFMTNETFDNIKMYDSVFYLLSICFILS